MKKAKKYNVKYTKQVSQRYNKIFKYAKMHHVLLMYFHTCGKGIITGKINNILSAKHIFGRERKEGVRARVDTYNCCN